ncbi:MAG: hypothetical protein Q7W55_12165 [Pseudohongiella sp.]|nr:hypothetical protein [Pseudohongiella sp.]MDO9519436.1 hypothetical protein [Pseudohongiella sp.]MDP2127556.1 hypothetical protein [Pseudohongiella sp.]
MSEQNQAESDVAAGKSDIGASIDWLRSLVTLSTAVFRLGIAEASLAREDLGRLILVYLLIVPVFLLTWIALGVLAAWIVFELSSSATLGIASFAAIQVGTCLLLVNRIKTYRHSFTLPETRAQIMAIIEEVRDETGKSTPAD